ncbi:hypothetical protein [Streptomyces koelreuteriae]|uniref:hypothetical protein n=1 Tax=Streptomyces koelreuteriae TaxID=2838015 RepID=UPI003EBA7CB9
MVQRFWKKPKKTSETAPMNTTGALASAAAATIAHSLTPRTAQTPRTAAPPPYTPPAPAPAPAPPRNPPPPYSAEPAPSAPPPYTEVPNGGFDPRDLTDFQLDELVHRLIGRITRLIRTELRMDRERIGRLRDPRH